MGGPGFSYSLSWMLVDDGLGPNTLLGIKAGAETCGHGEKRVNILYIDEGSCPSDRLLPEQTNVTWIKFIPVWL